MGHSLEIQLSPIVSKMFSFALNKASVIVWQIFIDVSVTLKLAKLKYQLVLEESANT